MTDELLVNGWLREDSRYQQALYDKYKAEMFMVCMRYAKSKAEAEDFLQDGFVQVFRDLHQFDTVKGSLQGWVRKVVVNKVLQHLRKKKLQFASADIADFPNQLPNNEDVLSMLSAKEIIQLIQQLPDGYRVVFSLFMLEGFSHQEIAEQLNISESTSKSQLHKARHSLQRSVNELISS